jgi:hypothetical protein
MSEPGTNDVLDDRLHDLSAGLHDRTAARTGDVGDVYARRRRADRNRRIGAVAGIVAVAVISAAALVAVRTPDRDSQGLNLGNTETVTRAPAPPAPPASEAPVTVPEEVGPGPAPGPTTPTTTGPAAPPPTPTPRTAGRYQLLFPFATDAEAQAWQREAAPQGHQPWHTSPEQTALAFTGFLGFTDIDRTFGTSYPRPDDAQVTVGFLNPAEGEVRVAVIHLIRLGWGDGGPWEVVGTEDLLGLTLDLPRYGADVTSPLTVGGTITGVDEHIRVRAYRPAVSGPVGDQFGVPGGGERTPWTTTVSFPPGPGTVLIVASTGGHLAEVERFAVTGVQSR